MSVIADIGIPPEDFELGRILSMERAVTIELETMVPMGEQSVPFLWVYDHERPQFEATVREHPAVDGLREVEAHEDRVLYAFRWDTASDELFGMFAETQAQILSATGRTDVWEFELRFPDHDRLSTLKEYCTENDVALDVRRIYNPTKPESGPHYGLSAPQREALSIAVNEGYYAIPRRISTKDLAAKLSISDQATTERLRRAIITLTEHTIEAEEASE